MNIHLPSEYVEFMNSTNVLWGETDYEFGGYFDLEFLDNIEQMNRDIEIEKYAPGYVAFASDGGGEVFAFDNMGPIFLLPLVGMEPSVAIKIASSWQEFKSHMAKNA